MTAPDVICQALERLRDACPVHGANFGALGFEWGQPRCESCMIPWLRSEALIAMMGLRVASDVYSARGEPLPADVRGFWQGGLCAELELSQPRAAAIIAAAFRQLPPGYVIARVASIAMSREAAW